MRRHTSMGSSTFVALQRALVLTFCLFSLNGCPGPSVFRKPTPGTTNGAILVDSPEVYHRERLIQDRERQKAWLHQQLEVDDAAFEVFEALISQKSLRSSSVSLGVDATPQAGLKIRETEAAVEALEREQAIADLEHQIRIAQLTERLKRAQEGELNETPGATTTPSTTGAGDGTSSSGEPAGSTGAGTSSAGTGSGTATTESLGLPTTSISALTARSSPISRFRDRLAFRELVRQEILENDLDDSHDLTGNTLYRWTFDATIFPGSDTSAWAVVQVDVRGDHPCDSIDDDRRKQLLDLLVRWKEGLYGTLDSDIWRVEQAILAEPAQWPADLLGFRQEVSAPTISTFRVKGHQSREQGYQYTHSDFQAAKAAAAQAVADVYQRQLPEAINQSVLRLAPDSEGKIRIEVGPANGDEITSFCTILKSLETRIEPYAVTPKETVQRIADLSAAQAASDRALGLALAAGTVGLESALKASRQELFQRDSILRQPLIVGFSLPRRDETTGHAQIGWILGPRFKPLESGFDFRHSPIQLALSAVVSLPAWWPSAKLEVRTCWVSDSTKDLQPSSPPCASVDPPVKHSVRLPGKPDELTRAIFPGTRGPKPYLTETPALEIDRPETIVLFGQNLWRNPVVLVGSERADRVEILPDMRGVSATFSRVRQPAGWSLGQQFSLEPIWVWTSEGTAIAGEARVVKRAEPPSASAEKALFKIETASPGLTHVASKDRFGVVRLVVRPEKDFPKDQQVHLTIERAEFDPSKAAKLKCLETSEAIWKITPPCEFDAAMRNLIVGEVVTLRAYRKLDERRKAEHPPISLEVR